MFGSVLLEPLVEPVPLVELPVLPVLGVALGSAVVEPEVLPVVEPLVVPVVELLPLVVPVVLLPVLDGCEDVSEVDASVLLRVVSRLQPAKPSAEAASADRSVSFN